MAPEAEPLADDEPQAWVQWDDGTWSPVYADGWTGEPVSLADVLATVTPAATLATATEPDALGVPIIDVEPLEVVDQETGHTAT